MLYLAESYDILFFTFSKMTIKLKLLLLAFCLTSGVVGYSQSNDELVRLQNETMANEHIVSNLRFLTKETPARMSGSKSNEKAVVQIEKQMKRYGVDSVWLQPVGVPNWDPGKSEVTVRLNGKSIKIPSIPLGLSVGGKVSGELVEITQRSDFEKLGSKGIKGKIVFINNIMDSSRSGYGRSGWQRMFGPSMAAQYGAVAVISRSLTSDINNYPYTGVTRYADSVAKIPALAISTADASNLSNLLKGKEVLSGTVSVSSKQKKNAVGYNVIADIRGTKHPEKVILLSAHIDSWFNSEGAQDNATGCVQVMEVMRAFKAAGLVPDHTIRMVIYQDEEMMLGGMNVFAEKAKLEGLSILFNVEVDAGAGAPLGMVMFDSQQRVDSTAKVCKTYGMELNGFSVSMFPGPDADFWPLTKQLSIPVYFYEAEVNDYFNIHHSAKDIFERVNLKNLKDGAAAIASFIYLMDKR